MHSFSPLPACVAEGLHLLRVVHGHARHVAAQRLEAVLTQPGSLFRHQSEVFFQLPWTYGRMCDVMSR